MTVCRRAAAPAATAHSPAACDETPGSYIIIDTETEPNIIVGRNRQFGCGEEKQEFLRKRVSRALRRVIAADSWMTRV